VVFDKDKTATAAYQLKQLSLSCTWNLNLGCNIKDKINKLSDGKLTNALFNEQMTVTKSHGCFHDVVYASGENKGESFRYCQLNEEEDFTLKEIKDNDKGDVGTKLIIKLKKASESKDYYRFRIETSLENLKTTSDENLFFIDGLTKEVSFIEFCINTPRKLPREICDELETQQEISSMNLFIMTDILTSFVFESDKAKSTRMLESHIWNAYLGRDRKESGVIANHWTGKSFHEYSLFVKVKKLKKNFWAIGLAILVIIILGICGNLATNYILSCKEAAQVITEKEVKLNKQGALTPKIDQQETAHDAPKK